MSSDQIAFLMIFAALSFMLLMFNQKLSSFMTDQWLHATDWLLPLTIRERRAYGTYKESIYWIYRITFYGGAALCVGAILFLLSSAGTLR
jgi:hypothetical protein